MNQLNAKEEPQYLRIPLVGETDTFVINGGHSPSPTDAQYSTEGQFFINFMPFKRKNPLTGKETFYARKRPGYSALTVISGMTASGFGNIKHWGGLSTVSAQYWAYTYGSSSHGTQNVAYVDSGGGVTAIGNITGLGFSSRFTQLSETDITGAPLILINTNNGSHCYYASTSAVTEITDGDFPTISGLGVPTGKFVSLNGYTFILCTNGRIYNSDLGSVSSWSANSFIVAQSYPDTGVTLARYKNFIAAFSQESIEFFVLNGNFSGEGSPLLAVPEMTIRLGATSQDAVLEFLDALFWIGQDSSGNVSVYKLDNGSPTKVSIPSVEMSLNRSGNTLLGKEIWGKPHLSIPVGTGDEGGFNSNTLYNIDDGIWWTEMGPGTGSISSQRGDRGLYYMSAAGGETLCYNHSVVSGSFTPLLDMGVAFVARIQTSQIDLDNHDPKIISRLTIAGQAYDLTNGNTPSFDVYVNDNGYTLGSWTAVRSVTLNSWTSRWGRFKKRAFHIAYTGSAFVDIILEGLDIQIKQQEGSR